MTLTNRDLVELTAWRRKLHQHPETSNEEEMTAKEVIAFLADTRPDKVLTALGGHGVAMAYDSGEPEPTVMLRSELDALPIHERSGVPHSSLGAGQIAYVWPRWTHDHPCCARPSAWAQKKARGRVVLMFQSTEGTGNGAAGVVVDPCVTEIAPDFAFSLHNLPGVPFGEVRLKAGVVNCASRGMRIALEGKTAHSSHARDRRLPHLGDQRTDAGAARASHGDLAKDDFGMVTVTHASMSEPVSASHPDWLKCGRR